jgi:hypothetical protein
MGMRILAPAKEVLSWQASLDPRHLVFIDEILIKTRKAAARMGTKGCSDADDGAVYNSNLRRNDITTRDATNYSGTA